MSKLNHIHKYMRIRLKRYGRETREGAVYFKCMIPECTHYIRAELVIGRYSECWRCRRPFVLTTRSITLKKPHCTACTKGRLIIPTESELRNEKII